MMMMIKMMMRVITYMLWILMSCRLCLCVNIYDEDVHDETFFLSFNFAGIIPHPSAWFPLNGTHETSEIEDRTCSGDRNGVLLSLGPDGTKDGSYFFRGSQGSSIVFSDSNSKLDIGVSITIVFWLYNYDNAKTTFLQYKGVELVIEHTELKLTFPKLAISNGLTGPLAEKGWTFVGVSYNGTTAEGKLWIDGNIVNSKKLTANFIGSPLLTLGGNKFKGKITQLMLFNLTLTQEQLKGIKGRMKLPGETESYIYKIKMIVFRHFKTYIILNERCTCMHGSNISLPLYH